MRCARWNVKRETRAVWAFGNTGSIHRSQLGSLFSRRALCGHLNAIQIEQFNPYNLAAVMQPAGAAIAAIVVLLLARDFIATSGQSNSNFDFSKVCNISPRTHQHSKPVRASRLRCRKSMTPHDTSPATATPWHLLNSHYVFLSLLLLLPPEVFHRKHLACAGRSPPLPIKGPSPRSRVYRRSSTVQPWWTSMVAAAWAAACTSPTAPPDPTSVLQHMSGRFLSPCMPTSCRLTCWLAIALPTVCSTDCRGGGAVTWRTSLALIPHTKYSQLHCCPFRPEHHAARRVPLLTLRAACFPNPRGAFMQVAQLLERQYPGMMVVGSSYPVAPLKARAALVGFPAFVML